jgi:eukaryotic-like serine/threonine-protein kinase
VDRVGRWSGERWKEISPYLDQALDLEASERGRWLKELGILEPRLADDLRALLATHEAIDAAQFLERSPLGAGAQPVPGQRFGTYTLECLLGKGAMGSVWQARRDDAGVDSQVAIKILDHRGVGRDGAEQIRRQADLLTRQFHPNIARLLDVGFGEKAEPFLVFEYVEGTPVDDHCRSRALPLSARLELLVPIIDAVAQAHAQGIVHLDLKPSNILVTAGGVAKLLDLGVAALILKSTSLSTSASIAKTAPFAKTAPLESAPVLPEAPGVTPAYAAPEQIRGEPAMPASDVYALGVLLHLLIAGRHPFAAETATRIQLIRAVLTDDARVPSESIEASPSKRWVSGDLDAVIAKAMQREPEDRYPTAAALSVDIHRFLSHRPVHARSHTWIRRAAMFLRRRFESPPV